MKILTIFFALLALCTPAGAQTDTSLRAMNQRETELYKLIMEYRQKKNLPEIAVSPSLTKVAQIHVRDLNADPPDSRCGMHSWSSNGPWKAVCYNKSGKGPSLMWSKPSELTPYTGNGYEIAFMSSDTAFTAEDALNLWKTSSGHNSVIINLGVWKDANWKAIGVAAEGNYALVWFGKEKDPVGSE